jgi:hypothetical protein
MGIFSEFGIFDTDDVDLHSDIEGGPINKLFRGVNALREHILDVTPVGKATRTFKGHDHADSGPPISRGCIYCEDNGNTPLWRFTPPTAQVFVRIDQFVDEVGASYFQRTDHPVATGYASPKLNVSTVLSGKVSYRATSSAFQLKLIELYSNKQVVVDLPEHNQTTQKMVAFETGLMPGRWNDWYIFAQAEKVDSAEKDADDDGDADPTLLDIFSLSLTETVWQTTPMVEVSL